MAAFLTGLTGTGGAAGAGPISDFIKKSFDFTKEILGGLFGGGDPRKARDAQREDEFNKNALVPVNNFVQELNRQQKAGGKGVCGLDVDPNELRTIAANLENQTLGLVNSFERPESGQSPKQIALATIQALRKKADAKERKCGGFGGVFGADLAGIVPSGKTALVVLLLVGLGIAAGFAAKKAKVVG